MSSQHLHMYFNNSRGLGHVVCKFYIATSPPQGAGKVVDSGAD